MGIRLFFTVGILAVAAHAAPPPLEQVTPNYSLAAGGQTVTIQAMTPFAGTVEDYQVHFGDTAAEVLGVDGNALSVVVPAGTAPQQVALTVTDRADELSTAVAGGFYYITGPPSILRVVDPASPTTAPPVGSTRGGHAVIVEGSGLSFVASVRFGGVDAPAASVNVLNDSRVAVTTPPNTSGLKTVSVQVEPGSLQTSTAGAYRYASGPAPEQVFPSVGASAGGSTTTIFGQALANVTSVTFGGVPATIVLAVADRVEVIVGPHPAGVVDVVVTSAVDSATLSNAYTFYDPPSITGITPAQGPADGGNDVTISGNNLLRLLEVRFGGVRATTRSITNTQLVVTAPARAPGTVTVEVSTVGGKDTVNYTYVPRPQVTGVSPNQGSTRGGIAATLSGQFLSNAQAVFFGANEATIIQSTDTQIQVLTPPRSTTGVVPVSVVTPGGTGGLSNAFTYVRGIGIDSVSPSRGFSVGGETITIKGTGFSGLQSVWVGGMPSLVSSIDGTTGIVIISPPGVAGLADVEVRTIAENFAQPGAYEYFDPDTIFGGLRGVVRDVNSMTLHQAAVVARTGGIVAGVGATDANGEYRISSLDPGEYNMEVFAIGYQREIANATVVLGEEETINFMVTPLPVFGGTIGGRVTELLNDTPLVGARVQAIHSTGIITTYTCGDGTYDLPGIPLGVSLNVTVAVSAPGYESTQREVMIGNQIANFVLNRGVLPGKLGGTVFDARDNSAIEDAQVILQPTLGTIGYGRSTGANGGFNYRNLDYATYDLRVSAKGYVPHFQNITLATVAGQQIVVKLQPEGGTGPGCSGAHGDGFAAGDMAALTVVVLALALAARRCRKDTANPGCA